jgi:sulfite dehydrogenase (cytochrome) subunit A
MNHSRRNFFALVAGGALFAQAPKEHAKVGMKVLSARPEDLEMPLSGFSDYITPIEHFFVRTHVYVPTVELSSWKLEVAGSVATPLSLTMAELRRMPSVELIAVAECAGNGRSYYQPTVPGLQWRDGSVGNGRWRGVRMADVLKRAGIKASAVDIEFNGADVPIGTMPDFRRSITAKKALDPNTLLAYEMNGETLPLKHGFPLRVITPGWASDSWVKWLTSITVLDKESDSFWMKSAYRRPEFPVEPGAALPPEKMQPVTSLKVKSLILSPGPQSTPRPGKPTWIRGVAWSGDAGPVTSVQVSVDNGRSWRLAEMKKDQFTQYGWREWEFEWTPTAEAYFTLIARASDANGNIQPLEQEWNPSGYGWNIAPRVGVTVTSAIVESIPSLPGAERTLEQPKGYREACLVCHGEDVIRQQHLTSAQWDREINKMVGWGADFERSNRQGFLDYLVKNFGPR